MPVKNRLAELQSEITAWRRDLHENPELLFDTHRTSGLVAERLRAFGCDEVVEGIGRTGVVGVIRGRSDTTGKVVGLRADMDALPIKETTGAPHASSKSPGAMHACGHDGHTAMLLGAAKYLAETRNFDGTCIVIFQPAEEGGGGGKEMVDDGMMDRWAIQEVYGMHNMPGLQIGAVRDPARRLLCGGRLSSRSRSRARAGMPPSRMRPSTPPSWRATSLSPCNPSPAATSIRPSSSWCRSPASRPSPRRTTSSPRRCFCGAPSERSTPTCRTWRKTRLAAPRRDHGAAVRRYARTWNTCAAIR